MHNPSPTFTKPPVQPAPRISCGISAESRILELEAENAELRGENKELKDQLDRVRIALR